MATTDFLSSGHSTPSSSGGGTLPQSLGGQQQQQTLSLKVLHQDPSTLTLLVDADFFDYRPDLSRNPADWGADLLKVIVPETYPSVRLYCLAATRARPHVVAAQFDLAEHDAVGSTRLLHHHLSQWLEEYTARAPASSVSYDRRTGRAAPRGGSAMSRDPIAKAPLVPVPTTSPSQPSSSGGGCPTLFSLVAKLGDPTITTVEQRHAIRQIITDYLNNEISHGKVFSYIGQVIGYQALDNIINALATAPAAGPPQPVPPQYLTEQPPLPTTTAAAVVAPGTGAKYTPAIVTPTAAAGAAPEIKQRAAAGLVRSLIRPLRWLAPTPLVPCPNFGHKACLMDRKCFMFGGRWIEEPRHVPSPTFEALRVLDLTTMRLRSSEAVPSPDCPPSMAGHVAHLGSFASGPICVVHGGYRPTDTTGAGGKATTTVSLNGWLYGVDMLSRRWTVLDDASAIRPCPRHSHASLMVPHNTDVAGGVASAVYAEQLLIFGGVGCRKIPEKPVSPITCDVSELELLNDLWAFDFMTGQWAQIELPTPFPSPRFGASLVWTAPATALLFGGEDREATTAAAPDNAHAGDAFFGTPPGTRRILADTWVLSQKAATETEPATYVWSQYPAPAPPCAHYAAVSLTACFPPPATDAKASPPRPEEVVWAPSVESCMSQLQTSQGWLSQRIVFLISGASRNADGVIFETPAVMVGLLHESHEGGGVDIEWRSTEPVTGPPGHLGPPFRGRRGHAAAYFDAVAELPSGQIIRDALKEHSLQRVAVSQVPIASSDVKMEEPKPAESETARTGAAKAFASTPTCVPCILVCGGVTTDRQPRSDVWVLALSQLLPRVVAGKREDGTLERKLMNAMILSGFRCVPSLRQLYGLPEEEEEEEDDKFRTRGFAPQDIEVLRQIWTDPALNYQPALMQTSTSVTSGLLWALATLVKHPLSAFGHLVDNAIQATVKASTVSVCLETWRGVEAITITDDGLGLSHRGLHVLLKRFGTSAGEDLTSCPNRFGLGFKLGVGRLAHNALVLTKSGSSFGAGLFSAPLNSLLGTTNFACPIACWSALDGFPVVHPTEEAEFGQAVGLLLNNSPLGTSRALEEEFAKFGQATGTRIILFGLRKDLPYACINTQGAVHFTSHRSKFEPPTAESVCPRGETTLRHDSATGGEEQRGVVRHIPGNLSGIPFHPVRPAALHTTFPLYHSASTSLDYNLSTYLYWLHLHAHPSLYVNGVQLISQVDASLAHRTIPAPEEALSVPEPSLNCLKQAGIELPTTDRYKSSLWRYLQNRLFHKMEFPFLFEPKFGEDNFYGLVGFLKDPLQPTPLSSDQDVGVSETGVLLYHKGRLITRAVLGLPMLPEFLTPPKRGTEDILDPESYTLGSLRLTAVINVPDFLVPRADKEGFLCDADPAVQDVFDRLETALKEYLHVLWKGGPEAVDALQQRYVKEFDAWRETRWNERRRRSRVASFVTTTTTTGPGGVGGPGAVTTTTEAAKVEGEHLMEKEPRQLQTDYDPMSYEAPTSLGGLEFEARGDEPREFSMASSPDLISSNPGGGARKRHNRDDPGSLKASSVDTFAPSGKAKRRRGGKLDDAAQDTSDFRGGRRQRRRTRRRSEEDETMQNSPPTEPEDIIPSSGGAGGGNASSTSGIV